MRRVRPKGLTLRITQPNGLRLQYLGVVSSTFNKMDKVFKRNGPAFIVRKRTETGRLGTVPLGRGSAGVA